VTSKFLSTSDILSSPFDEGAKIGGMGYVYTYIARFSALGVSFFTNVVLARMLTPADYGVYSIAFIIMSFILLIRDFGLIGFVIQKDAVKTEEVDFSFLLSSLSGALLSVLAFSCSAKIGALVMDERAAVAIRIMSVGVFASSFFAIHGALARRKLMFGLVLRSEIAGALAGLIAGVALALALKDYRAIAGAFAASVCTSALVFSWGLRWLPRLPKGMRDNLHVVAFGWRSLVYNVLNFFSNFAGIIGIIYTSGTATVGHYNRAQQLYAFAQGISFPVNTVLLPTLSRFQNAPDLYRTNYVSVLVRLGVVYMALGAFVFQNGSLLVDVLFGPQWVVAGAMFSWFGLAICALGLHSVVGTLFVSQSRMSELAVWGAADATIRVCGTLCGLLMNGPVGAVQGFGIATLFIAAPLVICLAGRTGPVAARNQFAAALPGVGIAVAVYLAQMLTPSVGWIGYDIILRSFVFVITVLVAALALPGLRGDIFRLSGFLRSRARNP
jgi:PST family polysaccharide transporter